MKKKYILFRLKRKILSKLVKNKIAKDSFKTDMTYNFLYKKLKNVINTSNYDTNFQVNNKTVWVCWLQGIEQAPELVKICFEKLQKTFKGYKVILVTSDNIKDYVEIPEYILEKWRNGIITNTHFSDILRVELLAKNGGIWIDSTVYVTDKKILKILEKNPLFVFKEICLNRVDEPLISASSWFIKCNANHPIILLTRDLIREYWIKNDVLIDYFLFHLCFTMARKKYSKLWDKIEIFNNVNPHILQFELLNKYNKERFEYYKNVSDVHKLSYKIKNTQKDYYTNLDYIMECGKNERSN